MSAKSKETSISPSQTRYHQPPEPDVCCAVDVEPTLQPEVICLQSGMSQAQPVANVCRMQIARCRAVHFVTRYWDKERQCRRHMQLQSIENFKPRNRKGAALSCAQAKIKATLAWEAPKFFIALKLWKGRTPSRPTLRANTSFALQRHRGASNAWHLRYWDKV